VFKSARQAERGIRKGKKKHNRNASKIPGKTFLLTLSGFGQVVQSTDENDGY